MLIRKFIIGLISGQKHDPHEGNVFVTLLP